ncbi:MAG: DegT/DnrJ/EryC1/StrS aminotransferase family protein, partial [Magnetococcales bacterium]|nr:DegT/DnrJ/EryC1/StrS aminotransferase family protein [Magnetococcales bacterium]
MIPRFKPWLDHREFFALFRRNRGAVARFEQAFAKEFHAVDAVSFPYGRSALWAFLRAVGVQDAEVVMPAYTCSVVAHAISISGNRPRFVDIRLTDYNMDLDLLPQAINEKTRAVVATHLFGYPLDLERVEAIVAEAEAKYGHKIWLIQDCAHSFGASWQGRLVTTSGDVALFGLNISKMMTSIFGGMLTFQDRELAAEIRAWRDIHFTQPSPIKGLMRRLYLLAIYLAFNEKV